MTDIRQSRQYADYLSQIGWIVERINNTNYFIKRLLLIGSVLKIQRPENIDFEEIERLRKKYRVFQIIIEPKNKSQTQRILNNGYKQSKSPYLPTKTLHLDLSISKQKLFTNLKKDAIYAIKRTINIQINIIKDAELFRKSWKKVVGYQRYVPPLSHLISLKKSFGDNAFFISSGLPAEDSAEAGAIFLLCGKTAFGEASSSAFGEASSSAYYWQAFTGKRARKSQIQYGIVWRGILWAKKKGAKIFDFEGIYDSRFPNKSWLGFTHFKKSFGGNVVEYPGCYTKWNLLP
ncbi:peptidoglycan bridge formation glycyltransferase FemA/FemB family protein [Patescibacteria group bacterium]|nr:peptidoglycan bridge formation glycyltransferase FemA/FemB family protein [Patescibacteria group bacterium]